MENEMTLSNPPGWLGSSLTEWFLLSLSHFGSPWIFTKLFLLMLLKFQERVLKGSSSALWAGGVGLRVRNVHLGNKVKAGPASSSYSASLCSQQGSFQSWPCRSWVLLLWGKQGPFHTYRTRICQRIQLSIFSITIFFEICLSSILYLFRFLAIFQILPFFRSRIIIKNSHN